MQKIQRTTTEATMAATTMIESTPAEGGAGAAPRSVATHSVAPHETLTRDTERDTTARADEVDPVVSSIEAEAKDPVDSPKERILISVPTTGVYPAWTTRTREPAIPAVPETWRNEGEPEVRAIEYVEVDASVRVPIVWVPATEEMVAPLSRRRRLGTAKFAPRVSAPFPLTTTTGPRSEVVPVT